MMENKMKNIKVGDVVHVRLHVVSPTANKTGEYWLHRNPGELGDVDHGIYLTEDNIVHIEPRPLKVGDKVRHKSINDLHGVIEAISSEYAWVKIYSAIKDFKTLYMPDLESYGANQ